MAGNTLFNFNSELAATQVAAASAAGVNEYLFGEFDDDGNLEASALIKSAGLRSGDIGPTPEPTTEDRQYDDGTTRTFQTGENLGSKELEVEGSSDDPLIALFIKYSRYGEKRGELLAYEAFNDDRTCFFGSARVQSARKPRDVKGVWRFTIAFAEVGFRPASDNPAPASGGTPAGSMAPTSGAIGTVVTVTGTNLSSVTSVTYGTATIAAASFTQQNATTVKFAVPSGQSAGVKAVAMNHAGGAVSLGNFTQS